MFQPQNQNRSLHTRSNKRTGNHERAHKKSWGKAAISPAPRRIQSGEMSDLRKEVCDEEKVAVEKEVKPEHGEPSISEVKGCGDAFTNQREEKREKQIEFICALDTNGRAA